MNDVIPTWRNIDGPGPAAATRERLTVRKGDQRTFSNLSRPPVRPSTAPAPDQI